MGHRRPCLYADRMWKQAVERRDIRQLFAIRIQYFWLGWFAIRRIVETKRSFVDSPGAHPERYHLAGSTHARIGSPTSAPAGIFHSALAIDEPRSAQGVPNGFFDSRQWCGSWLCSETRVVCTVVAEPQRDFTAGVLSHVEWTRGLFRRRLVQRASRLGSRRRRRLSRSRCIRF